MTKPMSDIALACRIYEKLFRRRKANASCIARPCAWEHGKWSGADLRMIRAHKGVGHPVKAAA